MSRHDINSRKVRLFWEIQRALDTGEFRPGPKILCGESVRNDKKCRELFRH